MRDDFDFTKKEENQLSSKDKVKIGHFICQITIISKKRGSMLFSIIPEFHKALFCKSSYSILNELQLATTNKWLSRITTK